MKYVEYVAAAYAIFFLFLAWDYLAPLIRIRKAIRSAKLRLKRESSRNTSSGTP